MRSATESEVECIHATHFLPLPDHQLKELQRETACEPTLQFVKKAILDGFQDTKEKQPAAIHRYFEIHARCTLSTWWCNIQGSVTHHNADPETKDQAEAT